VRYQRVDGPPETTTTTIIRVRVRVRVSKEIMKLGFI